MMSKLESRSDDKPGNSSSNQQLLCEIEALSRALHLQENASITLPNLQTSDAKPKIKNTEDAKKNIRRLSSSLWNWKKPLEALSHVRDHKFSCSFFLHVHTIEGLPPIFNDSSLQVQFKRKKKVLTTRPSLVSCGISVFDETLINRCNVYCRINGLLNPCIYEPKTFSFYVSMVSASGFDFGKHHVDLTRLLPLTVEELVGDQSTGRWSRSFKLSGEAKGAILNVSFGFSVTIDSIQEAHDRSSAKSRDSASVPLYRYLNIQMGRDDSAKNPTLEFSKSVRYLYQKLEEDSSAGVSDMKSVDLDNAIEKQEDDEDVEFTVIDRGIELELPRIEESKSATVGDESADEPESPRERLLREFEAESLISGDFIFGLDLDRVESGEEDEDDSDSEDYTTISSEEDDSFVRSIQCRRKAQVLEELETEALMRQWGLDETAFRVPPRCPLSSGFGSPVEIALEKGDDGISSGSGSGSRLSFEFSRSGS